MRARAENVFYFQNLAQIVEAETSHLDIYVRTSLRRICLRHWEYYARVSGSVNLSFIDEKSKKTSFWDVNTWLKKEM